MRHVGGTVELDGKELPIGDDRADEPLPLQGGLDHPPVRHERHEPDPQDRHGWSPSCWSRGASRSPGPRDELLRRLELVGLTREVLDRYPIELSGGMKQRMVMVISTLLNPSLLIADEVTSALDVSTQKAVAEALVDFRDRDFVKSMIIITHDLSLVYQIADTHHRHVRRASWPRRPPPTRWSTRPGTPTPSC